MNLYSRPDEGNVNDIQEAYGFSFMVAPEVGWSARLEEQKSDLFTYAVLETKTFVSKGRVKGTEREGGLETLSMLMLDLHYDGKLFKLDKAFYAEELEKAAWTVRFSPSEIGDKVMAVWIDHHGNEARVLISREDFGFPPLSNRQSRSRTVKQSRKLKAKAATASKRAK